MTRVRFDPHFVSDERWERLGAEAFLLHHAACSFTVAALSDGYVSAGRVRTLSPVVTDPDAVAAELVADGLWQPRQGGYVVCECLDDLRTAAGRGDEQPSRQFVEKERQRAARNKEAWRERHRKPTPDNTTTDGNRLPNPDRNPERNQTSGVRSSAVQDPRSSPAPAHNDPPQADTPPKQVIHTPCPHGQPDGLQPTRTGQPRCPHCRQHATPPH